MDSGKTKVQEMIVKLKRSKAERKKLEKKLDLLVRPILEFEQNTGRRVRKIHLSREINDWGEEEGITLSLEIT